MHKRVNSLFEPTALRGGLSLNNRVVMAPMTRSRAREPNDLPSTHAAVYYAQRASAGLIVTEGVSISPDGKGYSQTPGIYSADQAAAWKAVTSAVHQVSGSRIFLQLWHVGRMSHPEISGHQPLAPSAIRPADAKVWLSRPDGWQGKIDCAVPREMSEADIAYVVDSYRAAARRAIDAGFDGVEIHAANGYLIDQFLRATTNRRTDRYGGDVANRLQFMRDVVTAVTREVGAGRVGIRFSPLVGLADTQDPQMGQVILTAASWLDDAGVAYIHVVESDNADLAADSVRKGPAAAIGSEFRRDLRRRFAGSVILAHRYDVRRAQRVVEAELADLVAFGRPFIANPDLVRRMKLGLPLARSDMATWYGGGAAGYIDYPDAADPDDASKGIGQRNSVLTNDTP